MYPRQQKNVKINSRYLNPISISISSDVNSFLSSFLLGGKNIFSSSKSPSLNQKKNQRNILEKAVIQGYLCVLFQWVCFEVDQHVRMTMDFVTCLN